MRKLVSIKKIDEIRPIPNADTIEVAIIGGWEVVVKKGEFNSGSNVLYFEIDSILPKGYPEFEFLMTRSSGTYSTDEGDTLEGHRLRTIKLRGQVSQGLIIPLPMWMEVSDCGEYVRIESDNEEFDNTVRSIDNDFSDLFGIKKYEKRISANLAGFARGNFPSFIPKTDQERVQNLARSIGDWYDEGLTFEVTEKLDGTSCTIYKNSALMDEDKDALGVCSRNLDLKDSEGNVYWNIAHIYDIHAILLRDGRNLAIQGEIIGNGIQGNKYRLNNHAFYVFDIYDIDAKKYFNSVERQAFCNNNGLNHVPVLSHNFQIPDRNVIDLIPTADGDTVIIPETGSPTVKSLREGVVYKCIDNPSISFKVISNKWLMKNDE